MKLSAVVSYCSLDKRFISPLLTQLLMFCDDIVVVYFDKLLNGDPEPVDEIWKFLNVDKQKIRGLKLKYNPQQSSRYHHNLARWEASKITKHDRLLFLDADEIPDGAIFKLLLENNALKDIDAGDFKCFWYFRSSQYRAEQTEECGLYIKKSLLTQKLMFTEMERWSYRKADGIKYVPLMQVSGGPIMHHYSWVRTKEEMLQKVASWGHRHDRDWASQIQEEFKRDFNGTDFVHNYSYVTVPDKFGIGL